MSEAIPSAVESLHRFQSSVGCLEDGLKAAKAGLSLIHMAQEIETQLYAELKAQAMADGISAAKAGLDALEIGLGNFNSMLHGMEDALIAGAKEEANQVSNGGK